MGNLKKIVIIGPESTGKSTLTRQLAEYFHTSFVPEFAREYISLLSREYQEDDLLKIAEGQIMAEERETNRVQNNLLFCDTDLYVIKVWSEYKYRNCKTWILQQIAKRNYDLYLLAYIDVPWQNDPQREHPEPEMREYFYRIYRDIVIHAGCPWMDIRGNQKERLRRAVHEIRQLF